MLFYRGKEGVGRAVGVNWEFEELWSFVGLSCDSLSLAGLVPGEKKSLSSSCGLVK